MFADRRGGGICPHDSPEWSLPWVYTPWPHLTGPPAPGGSDQDDRVSVQDEGEGAEEEPGRGDGACLLYTSDAADDTP
eukprot:6149392-Pyramimonas_sp.AAC.1